MSNNAMPRVIAPIFPDLATIWHPRNAERHQPFPGGARIAYKLMHYKVARKSTSLADGLRSFLPAFTRRSKYSRLSASR
jgi:hypothetical protein